MFHVETLIDHRSTKTYTPPWLNLAQDVSLKTKERANVFAILAMPCI